jgi:hypothetical protein
MNPDFDNYLRYMADILPLMDCREAGIWYPNLPRIERYFEMVPHLRGLDITPDPERPMGEEMLVTSRKMPVVRFPQKVWYWEANFLKGDRLDVPAFKAQLEEYARSRTLPAFVNVYGVQGRRVEDFANLMAALDPARFQAVDYATFFHLAREKMLDAGTTVSVSTVAQVRNSVGVEWKDEFIRQAGPWKKRMNDPLMQTTSVGIKVTIAPGKNWAVVAVPDCKLPEEATKVRIRVGAMQGKAPRWVFKLYGDMEGFGTRSNWFFESTQAPMETVRDIDPRVRGARGAAWMLQLGLSGEPGDSVVFKTVEFF